MYKLYLTIEDDEGQKCERVIPSNSEGYIPNDIDMVVDSMIDSLEKSKQPL